MNFKGFEEKCFNIDLVLPVTIYYLNCIGAVFGVLLIEFLILAGFFSRIIKDRILIE